MIATKNTPPPKKTPKKQKTFIDKIINVISIVHYKHCNI